MSERAAFPSLAEYAETVERRLSDLTAFSDTDIAPVTEALRYSLLSGGKRLRPYLTALFCHMAGGDASVALDFGCALEMVHTYSLIHDDLPAMDNDDLRRGRPTCHRAFGEDVAILAGDALLTEAFGVVARCKGVSAEIRLEAVTLLSEAAGILGMIGGQTMDTCIPRRTVDASYLKKTQSGKTGALIAAACRLGCLSASLTEGELVSAADVYARGVGLAFQVCDDVLDAVGDEKTLGKPIGSDERAGKTTFYTLLGRDGALAYARELTDSAIAAVRPFAGGEGAIALAERLLSRQS